MDNSEDRTETQVMSECYAVLGTGKHVAVPTVTRMLRMPAFPLITPGCWVMRFGVTMFHSPSKLVVDAIDPGILFQES